MTTLRPNEQRLADAIISFAAEHGLPNRVSFSELVIHHGAPGPARYSGLLWAMANVAIPTDLAARGVEARRDDDGLLSLTPAERASRNPLSY